AVRSTLTGAGIEFVELPRLSAFRPVLAVRRSTGADVLAALTGGLEQAAGWTVRAEDKHGATRRWSSAERDPDSVARVLCRRAVTAPNGRTLTTSDLEIAVELWDELRLGAANDDGAAYPAGTLRRRQDRRDTLIEHLDPDTWRRAVDEGDARLTLPAAHI